MTTETPEQYIGAFDTEEAITLIVTRNVQYLTLLKQCEKALKMIVETEQEHCYETSKEINDKIQTRYDLRKCGDIARTALIDFEKAGVYGYE